MSQINIFSFHKQNLSKTSGYFLDTAHLHANLKIGMKSG